MIISSIPQNNTLPGRSKEQCSIPPFIHGLDIKYANYSILSPKLKYAYYTCPFVITVRLHAIVTLLIEIRYFYDHFVIATH